MISIIAAVATNGCIGINGKLPWHIPEDFEHFKRHTIGKVVLMGRKTWESLPPKYRPLPGRANVVITHQKGPQGSFFGAEVYHSIDEALAAHVDDDVFVIGGTQLYRQTLDRADRLMITHVDQIVNGDVFFPEINAQQWFVTIRDAHDGFTFTTYERMQTTVPAQVDNQRFIAIP
ncbi:dihydrofolate reductase [Candidatus Uhrbacteria bacterium]|nr:dihydrofolate reductase [Candidatus Uhrbacteria bacterium]